MEEEKRAPMGAFFRSGVYSAFEDTESQTRFLKTVTRYNELCRRGRDTDFGKDAKLLRPLDRRQQVLDERFEPIPGLYATGNCSGCRFGTAYATSIPGESISTANTLGMLMGWQAAEQ